MIASVLVLGAGSAGLIAAITLKRKIAALAVRIIRSLEVGVIGVGESTTPNLPTHLFDCCKISRKQFYALANPTWKMGIHFLWGPRPCFEFGFVPVLDAQWSDLRRPHGFYCDEDFSYVDLNTALMAEGKAFPRQPGGGGPEIPPWHAFHLDNPKFVAALEVVARQMGIEFIDANVRGAERGPTGIAGVVLEPDGRRLQADFYVDASGFRSELLGRTLQEPFISFSPSLFCDRAIVGSWQRTDDEPILPYTTAETMEAGWCWRIEHEHTVNRGYVYSSAAISDDAARNEFVAKNPKAKTWDRVVKFVSGRYRRAWVDNVVGIGNACGFVEPLEATALMVTCWHAQSLVDMLLNNDLSPTPTMRDLFNEAWSGTWDEIRDFLTLHYHRNGRIQNDFWTHCHHDADISRLQSVLEFYEQNGPTGFLRYKLGRHGNLFGVDGFLIILVGLLYPYKPKYTPTEAEWRIWNGYRERFRAKAKMGMDVKEALAYVKHPNWRWYGDT
jgi:tryptophan 7-halogenase